jgi:hypothetical protein
MNDTNSSPDTTVRFISGFSPVIGLTGTRHHNPAAPGGPHTLAVEGAAVVHITGTTAQMLEAAGRFHAASVPILYSPMLTSAAATGNRWRRAIVGGIGSGFDPGAGLASTQRSLANRIGSLATRVAAENEFIAGYLEDTAGIDGGKIVVVGVPPLDGSAAGTRRPEGGEGLDGNLLVAFCDELTPEWNVLHLIFALEKINADAVIVTGRAGGEYAQACLDRAGLNPRVKLIVHGDEGGTGDGGAAGSIGEALARAAVVVDPSADGLCYPPVAAAAAWGRGAVISRRSVCRLSMPGEVELFEPSSWELLNHAITTAFNTQAGTAAAGGGRGLGGGVSGAELVSKFREIYADIPRGRAGR